MKKITSLLFLLTIVSFSFAQERIAIEGPKLETNYVFSKLDTLQPPSFATTSGFTTYFTVATGSTDTGYVLGTNHYNDFAKAQQFLVETPYNIFGGLIWMSTVVSTATGGNLSFRVWDSNGNGTATSGAVNFAPGTVVGSLSVPIQSLTFGGQFPTNAHAFTFTNPVWVTRDYYIGINMQGLLPFPQNKIGVVSSVDGSAGQLELAWEQWDTNAWYSLQAAGWGGGDMDIDMMIFPIVDQTSSIQENFISGMITNIYPNPTSDIATLEFNLRDNANNVTIMILDMNGKLVSSHDLGAKNAGLNTFTFDVSNMASGSYFYTIQADRNRFAKIFQVK